MELITEITDCGQWIIYQRELIRKFSDTNMPSNRYSDVNSLIRNVNNLFTHIFNEQIKLRQSHRHIHEVNISNFYREINELVTMLNDQYILEILGD